MTITTSGPSTKYAGIWEESARLIEAVIKSAVGNAEDKGCRHLDDLIVTVCRIDDGPMYKRIQPRARGTAFSIFKRLAHIHVTVTDVEAFEAMQEQELAKLQAAAQVAAPTVG